MAVIKLSNQGLILDTPYTIITSNQAATNVSLLVQNTTGFLDQQIIIVGALGGQGSELVSIDGSPSSPTQLDLLAGTVYPHTASTPVQVIQYDQVEFSTALTIDGSKTVLATVPLWADNDSTNYIDNSGATGYYFGRFFNSVTSSFSSYSDPIPVGGYDLFTTRTVIDGALQEINKTTSPTLSDAFAFQQLNNCQTEVIQDLKRWSFMQLFDQTVGHTTTGSWKFTLPTNIGVDNSNKSIYQLRVATQQRLVWVDKEKFDEFLVGVAYSTLSIAAGIGDLTLTLVDSTSFNSLASQTQDGTGTVTIGANTYGYSANDTTTGILTLNDAITADTVASIGADVFQGATQGLPNYWTTYGGIAYYWPIASQSYNGFQLLMDYYIKQTQIVSDSDTLIISDPTVAIAYLCWKFLKKLANGEETEASLSYMNQYNIRKEKMRVKEVMNRTFKFRPRYQNFAVQSEFNESTPRWVRDAEFPNTGF